MSESTPRVFISYSWSTPEHEQRVLALATRLIQDGINVVLDKWDLQVGQDKYAFMEQMVTDPSIARVLLICDHLYSEKADGRRGGVGTETQIVSPEVYERVEQTKFVPVIFEKDADGRAYTPTYLRARCYVDMSTPALEAENYEQLVRLIYNKPEFQKPGLGSPPAYIIDEGREVPRTAAKLYSLRSALESDRPVRHQMGLLRDALDVVSEALAELELEDTELPLDERTVRAVDRFTPYRDDFVGVASLVASLGEAESLFRVFTDFFEAQLPHLYARYDSPEREYRQFILYEMFLYYVAVLMRHERFAELDALLSHYFILPGNGYEETLTFDYTRFERFFHTLDEDRKRRLNSRRLSPTADLIRERATLSGIGVTQVMEADLLLFLRYVYVNRELERAAHVRVKNWIPRTIIFAQHGAGLPFFSRVRRRRDFDRFKQVLRATTPDDLMREEKLGVVNEYSQQMTQHYWLADVEVDVTGSACLTELGRLD